MLALRSLNTPTSLLTRRVIVWLGCALLLSFTLAGCKRRPNAADAPPELPANLISAFTAADPAASAQLTHGVFDLEGDGWRWTSPAFGVALAVPEAAANGVELKLRFTLPDVVFTKTGPVTLSATANGATLAPLRIDGPGEHIYAAKLPAEAFRPNSDKTLRPAGVAIEFHADKSLPPSTADARELSLILSEVGLYPAAP